MISQFRNITLINFLKIAQIFVFFKQFWAIQTGIFRSKDKNWIHIFSWFLPIKVPWKSSKVEDICSKGRSMLYTAGFTNTKFCFIQWYPTSVTCITQTTELWIIGPCLWKQSTTSLIQAPCCWHLIKTGISLDSEL